MHSEDVWDAVIIIICYQRKTSKTSRVGTSQLPALAVFTLNEYQLREKRMLTGRRQTDKPNTRRRVFLMYTVQSVQNREQRGVEREKRGNRGRKKKSIIWWCGVALQELVVPCLSTVRQPSWNDISLCREARSYGSDGSRAMLAVESPPSVVRGEKEAIDATRHGEVKENWNRRTRRQMQTSKAANNTTTTLSSSHMLMYCTIINTSTSSSCLQQFNIASSFFWIFLKSNVYWIINLIGHLLIWSNNTVVDSNISNFDKNWYLDAYKVLCVC